MDPALAQWLTWALQGLIAAGLVRIFKSLDETAKSLAELRESLPATYLPTHAFDIHRAENRADIDKLRDQLSTHTVECPGRLRAVK